MSDEPTRIPFNDLARYGPSLWRRVAPRLVEMIEGGWYVLGANVHDFEQCFANYLGGGDAIGVANGTDGLELALRAVGVGPRSKVALAANAGFYSSTAIRSIGAEPVYIDIAPGRVSPGAEEIIDLFGRTQVAAVVITHLYGRVAQGIETISELCRHAGVPLVEDCSQAHGARRDHRLAGTFGDVAVFSFYPTKNLGAMGDGGAVFSVTPAIGATVRSLRQYGWGHKYVVERAGGRNSRLDELQAAVLVTALDDLDSRNERRRVIIESYLEVAANAEFLSVDEDRDAWVGHLCVIAIDKRDQIRDALERRGVSTDVHFPVPDHRQPIWGSDRWPDLPNTEALAKRVLSVPCFPDMTDAEVAHVAAALEMTLN